MSRSPVSWATSRLGRRDRGPLHQPVAYAGAHIIVDLNLDKRAIVSHDRFAVLAAACESDLEQEVLEAQRTIYDGEPLVIADFFYEPKIVVFVDGSPHQRDYVQEDGRRKRMRLKGLGYRLVVVKAEEPGVGLDELASWMDPRR